MCIRDSANNVWHKSIIQNEATVTILICRQLQFCKASCEYPFLGHRLFTKIVQQQFHPAATSTVCKENLCDKAIFNSVLNNFQSTRPQGAVTLSKRRLR